MIGQTRKTWWKSIAVPALGLACLWFVVQLFSSGDDKAAIRYTDMAELLALCDAGDAPAVKEALPHASESALRNGETTLLHALLERDASPEILREALSPGSPLLNMATERDAQGRTPLHIAAARANPAALLLLYCAGAWDMTPDADGRFALDVILSLSDEELAARLPFWEERGKQEGKEVTDLLRSKTLKFRGSERRLEARGFVSYVSLAKKAGDIAYVAAVQAAAALQPEDGPRMIFNNGFDLPYVPDKVGLTLPSSGAEPWSWRSGNLEETAQGRRAALLKCLWPGASSLMLGALVNPVPERNGAVLAAEWLAWNIPGDVLGPVLWEQNENFRKRAPGETIWFGPTSLVDYPWYSQKRQPIFSAWLLLAGWRDVPVLPSDIREGVPFLAALCDMRAALGRERWQEAGPHLCAAAWLAGYTDTDRLLQAALDTPDQGVEMKTRLLGLQGAQIVPGVWRGTDALRCWAAGSLNAGPGKEPRKEPGKEKDAGEPLVKVASSLGAVDEETGELMLRMMLDSGARPDVADRHGVFPKDAARQSGASEKILALFDNPPEEKLYKEFARRAKEAEAARK